MSDFLQVLAGGAGRRQCFCRAGEIEGGDLSLHRQPFATERRLQGRGIVAGEGDGGRVVVGEAGGQRRDERAHGRPVDVRRRRLAVVGILTGLLLVIEPWDLQANWLSNSFGIGAAICWAMGTVMVKKLRRQKQVSLLALTAWSNLIGSVPVALIASVADEPPIHWAPEFIGIMLVLTSVSTAFCWWLWTSILDRVPAWEASLLVLGTPVIAIISSRVILGEAFSHYEIAGILLIGSGLLLLSFVSWLLERRFSSSHR